MSTRLPLKDIQFIADFAAFCRTKGDEGYRWERPNSCALGQFGYTGITLSSGAVAYDREGRAVPYAAYQAAALCSGPYTFSALADRLEALLVDAPVVERQ